ncbi:MAG: ATPase [Proteobacteria bacterium]|nr:ATPase [Pseudomonadota bacterium]
MKRFRHGLIVGKFAPLHLGHDHLIRRGLEECESLVVISYTRPEFEEFPPALRRQWLEALYPEAAILVLDSNDPGLQVPENTAPDEVHRDFVSRLYFERIHKPLDAVFTSESYGDGFAERLTRNLCDGGLQGHSVTHVNVDQARTRFPVSGTLVRSSLPSFRHLLPPEVSASLPRSVCLLGAESTGKSTLSRELASRFKTVFVEEYGRTLWEQKNGKLSFEDYLEIAHTHIRMENSASARANRFYFVDTSPLTTLFYSEVQAGRVDPALIELSYRSYDRVFLCEPDFPLVQDGTRGDERFRANQHNWYLRTLGERKIPYTLLDGPLEKRIEAVTRILSAPADLSGKPSS